MKKSPSNLTKAVMSAKKPPRGRRRVGFGASGRTHEIGHGKKVVKFITLISTFVLVIGFISFTVGHNFDFKSLMENISDETIAPFDFQQVQTALNALYITADWGELNSLRDFFNVFSDVFKGLGYIIMSMVYVLGLAFRLLGFII